MNSEDLYQLSWCRVTRYDPAKRDERGAYQGVTWTSISDVGRHFDGELLTMETYIEVEDAYVDACVAFAREIGNEFVEVRLPPNGSVDAPTQLRDGELLSIEAARDVVRKMLREEHWCRLESPNDDFAIHVGYDLYTYIGSSFPCEAGIEAARASGLFVDEDFLSPHIPEDDDVS